MEEDGSEQEVDDDDDERTHENQGKEAEKLAKHEDGEDEQNGRRRGSRRTSMQDGHARS